MNSPKKAAALPRQADRVCAALEEMVLTGRFRDGERLDEASLARHFGVSRTPVREALERLVKSGLAKHMPRRGVFVQLYSSISLMELFETMAEIEGVCSRLAAERVTIEGLDLLIAVNERCQEARHIHCAESYSTYNTEFHRILYRMSGNAFLEEQAVRLYGMLHPFRRLQFLTPGRMDGSIAEHEAIITALTGGHIKKAERSARDHVAAQGAVFHNHVAALRRKPDAYQPH